jgi:hypothetical protein
VYEYVYRFAEYVYGSAVSGAAHGDGGDDAEREQRYHQSAGWVGAFITAAAQAAVRSAGTTVYRTEGSRRRREAKSPDAGAVI